jgi:hypothetical protein
MASVTIDTLASRNVGEPFGVHFGQSADSSKVQEVSGQQLDLRPVPNPLSFAPTIDARLKIKRPFLVRIERDGNVSAAVAEEINEFGYGCNTGEALMDLGRTIAELYLSLASATNLSGDLARVRAVLEDHIQRVRS